MKLRYKEPDGEKSKLVEFTVADPGNSAFNAASANFRFSAAVACFGLALRDPATRDGVSLPLAAELAHAAVDEDPHGYRREFVELARRAERLSR